MSIAGTLGKTFTRIFGSRNERVIKSYRRRVERINALEPAVRKLTDSELAARTAEFRRRIVDGDDPRNVMYEAFAVMREAIDRNIGIRNIFNPKHAGKFDPAKLPAAARALYDQVRQQIAVMEECHRQNPLR